MSELKETSNSNHSRLHLKLRAVLGIDAAWTATQPSGVALVVEGHAGWKLASISPSYSKFIAAADGVMADSHANGYLPDVQALLAACERLYSVKPDIVAVDMPLSLAQIISRRVSDNLVSRRYGSRHCSTHTPSSTRPGIIADNLRMDFADVGYVLATSEPIPKHALIEVYPHPALVELAQAERRLPYKVSKMRNYWAGSTPSERRQLIIAEWARIVALLDTKISGVFNALPPPNLDAPVATLKAYEDQVDAIICAWVATCVLQGCADPFGDADSAIWVPHPSTEPPNQIAFGGLC